MTTPPIRLSGHERHILWLIKRGLLTAKGSDRGPTVISLRERGFLAWTERGPELTARGRAAQEWGELR